MNKWTFSYKDATAPSYLGEIEEHEGYHLVGLRGAMDKEALERNRVKMTAIIKKFGLYSKDLLCDFAEVTTADTATAAALVSRLSDFRSSNHRMIFFNVPARLKIYLDVTKVTPLFSICDTLEEALKMIETKKEPRERGPKNIGLRG